MKKKSKTRHSVPGKRQRKALAPAARQRGILFSALPTNRSVGATLSSDGDPQLVLPGRTILDDAMKSWLAKHARPFCHPGARGSTVSQFDWVVNILADPDHYADALQYLDHKFASSPIPVFNRPGAVLQTRRDLVWQRLADVDNLICPRCIRFKPALPQDFRTAFEADGFVYPVLVRPAGSHTAKHLLRINSEQDWEKIHAIPWGGCHMYMTQWVDFQHQDGSWPKLRLSITPDSVRLRHILYGDNWLVHSTVRDAETASKELEVLLNADNWEVLQQLGRDIRQRIGLDFFGADIGWKSDREFVLFEANASMSILSRHNMPEHRREDYTANLQRIEKDVWRALANVAGKQALPG